MPRGLLINSINSSEGTLTFLTGLPEHEIENCAFGCYDYGPFGVLLRFPVHMECQRANALIEKAYACLDAGDDAPKLTLINPELISPAR